MDDLIIEMQAKGRFQPVTHDMVFVFGSNEAGRHGAGAAAYAHKQLGAEMGVSFGPTGNCFAIPTKDDRLKTLPLGDVRAYVQSFIKYAMSHPHLKFQVTQIGCGLAGFYPEQIAPMFTRAPMNCFFDLAWRQWILRHSFWGTFP